MPDPVRRLRLGAALALIVPLALAPAAGAAPADDVLRVLREAKTDKPQAPSEVARRLEPVGPAKIAALRLALLNDDPCVRARAAGVLGFLKDSCTGLMSRLLEDDSPDVRSSAADALVQMGSPALEPLTVLVERRPPTSAVFPLALDTIGRIGGPGGAARVCAVLERYRAGGFAHQPAWAALRAMGPVAAVPLVRLVRYRELRAEARLTLLSYETAALVERFTAALADPAVPARERLDLAEEAECLLGTGSVRAALEPFLKGIEVAQGVPDELRGEAGAMLRRMQAAPRKALTAQEVKTAERERLAKEEREDAEQERRKKSELDAARAADAAEDRRELGTVPRGTGRSITRPVTEPYGWTETDLERSRSAWPEQPTGRQGNPWTGGSERGQQVTPPPYRPPPPPAR